MLQPSVNFNPSKTEADIAVLQVQYSNIDEKVDDLKTGLREIRDHMDGHMRDTQKLIKDNQETNVKAHNEMSVKINALEKWKWMLMGAGVLAGAIGWPVLSKVFGM